ncbi:MAG: carbohydate-binding domain-containing protein [Bacteroidales bacterium]|jgi:hexosaminidase|nr:carbohydate-binding domain-containing protein [Bacteroidales bacterium]
MKKSYYKAPTLLIASLIILSLTSCADSRDKASRAARSLSIAWEMTGNHPGENESCNARFTFINNDSRPITGEGWMLFFNQATVMPREMPQPDKGIISHINGDFYSFTPGPSFKISPGDSLVINYAYSGIMIKETDAPCGMYFASTGNKKRTGTYLPQKYTVRPFSDYSLVFPGMPSLYPTPENEYLKNRGLTDIAPENLCPVIPTPNKLIAGDGFVELADSTVIFFEKGLENEADQIITYAADIFGGLIHKKEGINSNPNSISLRIMSPEDAHATPEAYRLISSREHGIIIEGCGSAGVFYGIQTLLSLIPLEDMTPRVVVVHVPCVEIHDSPRFRYRGFLLDLSRNFQDKYTILKLIDLLSFFKINTLDLRLTDDEGWRVEIEGLPELTETGSRRGHTLTSEDCLPPSFGSGPVADAAVNYGTGFLSRRDYTDIVAYAGKRHITIIPEICFPGHARAAIVSMEARYNKYLKDGNIEKAVEYRLKDPDDKSVYLSAQKYNDNIACVALPSVYRFYEKVVTGLSEMHSDAGYPLKVLHTGGDEVPENAWMGSPLCLNLMEQDQDLKNTRDLQAMFFRKTLDILKKYNLGAAGWEEIVLTLSPEGKKIINKEFTGMNVLPYVWDNTGENTDLGYRIANAGYKIIMCNVRNLYFDLSYNTDPREPGLYWGGFQDAKDPYALAPYDALISSLYDDFGNLSGERPDNTTGESLNPSAASNIPGLQAQLWSETVKGPAMLEYYVLPKLFAFAEKAWASAPAWETEPDAKKIINAINTGWNEFANRIGRKELPRFDYLFGGFNYRIPSPGAVYEHGLVKANIAYPGMAIRYTTDGSDPLSSSPVYASPFEYKGIVKLKAFSASGRGGRTVTLDTRNPN